MRQLTIDGRQEDVVIGRNVQDHLFTAPQTIKGQMAMEPAPRVRCPQCDATHPSPAAVCFGQDAPHRAVKMIPIDA